MVTWFVTAHFMRYTPHARVVHLQYTSRTQAHRAALFYARIGYIAHMCSNAPVPCP